MARLLLFAIFFALCLPKTIAQTQNAKRPLWEGFEVALVGDQEVNKTDKNTELDHDILFDNIADELRKYVNVRNLKNIKKQIELEGSKTNIKTYLSKVYFEVQLVIKLNGHTKIQKDALRNVFCKATISVVGEQPQTHRKLFSYQYTSGPKTAPLVKGNTKKAKKEAMKSLAQFVAKKLVRAIRPRCRLPIRSGVYELKFEGFTSEQFSQITNSILELTTGKKPYCKILSKNFSKKEKVITVKWSRRGSSQWRIIGVIKEACAESEVYIKTKLTTRSVIVFQLGEDEEWED